jgi:hypothetical protein
LGSIETQDSKASATVIPYNHCAVAGVAWLGSTKGALRLGSQNRNTVYLLHDNPDNDPRVALKKPEVCTSSVMIGTSSALLALCIGKRAMTIVDIVADASEETPAEESLPDGPPLNVVHIRVIEEYARLQRTRAGQSASQQVDVQA